MSRAARALPLSPEQSASLRAFLEGRLESNECDHSLRNTKEGILALGVARRAKQILRWLESRGGFCDCEVLHNAMASNTEDAP